MVSLLGLVAAGLNLPDTVLATCYCGTMEGYVTAPEGVEHASIEDVNSNGPFAGVQPKARGGGDHRRRGGTLSDRGERCVVHSRLDESKGMPNEAWARVHDTGCSRWHLQQGRREKKGHKKGRMKDVPRQDREL